MAGLALALFAFFLLSWRIADAQTWQWQVVVRNPNRPPINSESRVVLSEHDLLMTYAARTGQTDVPIASCHASPQDVANARTLKTEFALYLYVAFKPGHPAQCQSGNQPIALVPVTDDSAASEAVATINRVCCGAQPVARTTPKATPPPNGTPPPKSSPQPAPSSTPQVRVTDWVETDGLFTYVRVQNRGREPVTIAGGQIDDCKAVAAGCGPVARTVTIAPDASAVVATVMSAESATGSATFSYRFDARTAAAAATVSGTSHKEPSASKPAMTSQEIRSAQATVLASLRSASAGSPATPSASPSPRPPLNAPVHLTQRGSSRLAIGQTGQATVRVRVSAKGMLLNASIVSVSNPALVAAALETAASSAYAPAIRDGRPVDGDYIATFQFDGQDPALSSIPVWRRPQSPAPSPTASAAAQ